MLKKSSTTVSAMPVKLIDDKDLRTNVATGIVHDYGPLLTTVAVTEQYIPPPPPMPVPPPCQVIHEDWHAPMPDISNL